MQSHYSTRYPRVPDIFCRGETEAKQCSQSIGPIYSIASVSSRRDYFYRLRFTLLYTALKVRDLYLLLLAALTIWDSESPSPFVTNYTLIATPASSNDALLSVLERISHLTVNRSVSTYLCFTSATPSCPRCESALTCSSQQLLRARKGSGRERQQLTLEFEATARQMRSFPSQSFSHFLFPAHPPNPMMETHNSRPSLQDMVLCSRSSLCCEVRGCLHLCLFRGDVES
jgi:hypothetical protein